MVIIIGFLAGFIARSMMSKSKRLGFILTTLVGIGGALLASTLMNYFGIGVSGNVMRFLAAVGGSVLLLWSVSSFSKK
ncbi:MAG: GlsB/YeaQ/YmgE family stress response membrane protein [Arenimonas sp.]